MTAPIRPLGLDHVVLRIADLSRSLEFYCEVLGCELERAREELGLYHLRAGAAQIDLVPVDGQLGGKGGGPRAADGPNMDHFCLRIEPFEAESLIAHLRAHGLQPGEVAQRFGAEGDGPSLYVQDPDGNTVELKGPARK
ncbi:MAG: VOC family protein [Alphaproteobacteria bacterium]|jgi:catechol 2,3-dioxygenase-like lactoylglutathione lyase family enzyme|nr:VOC family protein [Alphaproteobacteria bacterium]MDP6564965.1 VOC family protein [Alphaproteobacteria bacterium]MDP6811811.1 VOC family protein [Alphaproteobacteria bacterium]